MLNIRIPKIGSAILFLMMFNAVYAQVDLNNQLAACYTFNGNADDGSGNGLHGTVAGATLTTDRFGNSAGAYMFNGSGQIEIPAAELRASEYTYALWIKVTSHPGVGESQVAFSIGDQFTGRHQTINVANLYGTANLTGINGGGHNFNGSTNTTSLQSPDQPSLDTWYHVVSTRSQNEMRLYVNGVLKATGSTLGAAPDYGSSTKAFIGARCTQAQRFLGAIDDFVIYRRVLNSQEITKLYTEGLPCIVPIPEPIDDLTHGLVACYSFTGNAEDGSGNDLDGTVTGATLSSDRFGNHQSAYTFDGNDMISIPAEQMKNNEYTIAMWILISSHPPIGASQVAISIGDLYTTRHQTINVSNLYGTANLTGINSGGHNYNGSTNTTSLQSPDQPTLNHWYHVVSTRKPGEMRLYVDGVLKASGSTFGALPDYGTTTRAHIGARCNLSQYFLGMIDDVVIYDRALKSSEILKLYTDGIPCLIVQAPLVENKTHCGPSSFSLEATGGTQYRWYDAPSGGNLLYEGSPYHTGELSQSSDFFVSNVFQGVESHRVKMTVTITPALELACVLSDTAVFTSQIAAYGVNVLSGTHPIDFRYQIGEEIIETRDTVVMTEISEIGNTPVIVEATDINGCMGSCETVVTVIEQELYVPNFLSPNHDSFNEVFTVYVKKGDAYFPLTSDQDFSMIIYNRYGKEIFRTNDSVNGWMSNGYSAGTYYYHIKAGTAEFKGWVENRY